MAGLPAGGGGVSAHARRRQLRHRSGELLSRHRPRADLPDAPQEPRRPHVPDGKRVRAPRRGAPDHRGHGRAAGRAVPGRHLARRRSRRRRRRVDALARRSSRRSASSRVTRPACRVRRRPGLRPCRGPSTRWRCVLRLVLLGVLLYAQTMTSASVTGVVRDSSEAVVPGATVAIRNHDTNQVWTTVSDERGRFRLQYLPVGEYHLSVQLPGFTVANANLSLQVGDQVDVPIVLKPALSESVQVQADSPIVEARRTEMASTIAPREVDTLPLNGRNYLDLAQLVP